MTQAQLFPTKFKIDKVAVREKLQVLAGNLKVQVTLDKHMERAASAYITDLGFAFNLNPSKIRCLAALENRVQFCVDSILEGG